MRRRCFTSGLTHKRCAALAVLVVSGLLVLGAPSGALAQTLHWDGGVINGGNPAANANGGAGTWNTTLTNWDTAATAGASTAWVNGANNATFGGTAGIVTLGAPITAHNLTFSVSGYTIAGSTLTLDGVTPTITGTGTISSVIAGTAGLTTGGGANTLTLSGASTFTGPLTIAHGILAVNTGSVVLAPGASLATSAVTIGTAPSAGGATTAILQNQANDQLTNATVTFNAIGPRWAYWQLLGTNQSVHGIVNSSGAGVIENTEQHVGFGNSTLTLTGTGTYSFNGFMRSSAGGSGTLALVKSGAGTQTLSGGNINYTGATTVNSGQLILRNATAFQSATTVNSGATLSWSGTVNLNILSTAHTIALNNGGTLENLNPANWTILNGAVTNAGTTTINQTSNATGVAGEGLYLDGGLHGSGTVTINAANAGSGVNFRNNNTTFAGTIIVNGIASSTAFAGSGIGVGGCTTCLTNADITLNGTMELLNQGVGWGNGPVGVFNMGALSGTGVMVGNFTASGGQTAVTLGNTNNSGSFSGVIANGAGNTVRLVKTGTGTQTLAGSNTYTGGTTISGGTLQLGSGGTSGSIQGNVTNNAALAFNRSDTVTFGGLISGTGVVNQIGIGTTALTATNTYGGGTTISAGTLQLGNGGTTGSIVGNVTNNAALTFNRSNTLTFGGVISGTGEVNQIGAGTTVLTATNTYTGATTINAGILRAGAAAGGQVFGNLSAVTLADVAGATLDLNNFNQTIGSLSGGGTTGGNVTLGTATLTTGGNNASTVFGGVVSGTGGLVKTGTGTQALTGDNTYSGVTTINAGTLQLGNGGTSGSIAGDVLANGTLAFNRSNSYTFAGVISGGGALQQIGSGLTNLTGNSSGFTGTTSISAGTLAVNGSLCGDVNVLSGGRLQGTGTVCDTTNFAGGTVAPGNSIGTITVAGNYTGVGGTLEIEAILGGDASPTDLLHVTGNTSGPTNVDVINLGGTGAQTVEGIRIVQVDGVSAGAFSLRGDYVFEGDQAVVGGAYAYRLYQGGTSTPADGDWYLRSDLIAGDPSAGALLQPGAPLYESYANVLQSFNQLRTMQQRIGNRSWGPGVIETETPDGLVEHHGIWGQIEATRASFDPVTSTASANYDLNLWKLHAGMDGVLSQNQGGTLVGGVTVGFGTVSAAVSSPMGAGSIDAQGYSLGGALTWYGAAGFYVDGQAQATFYNTDIFSSTAGRALVQGNSGFGYGLSIEVGQQVELGSDWSVTPQAQLAYSNVSFSFNDAFGSPVTLEQGDSLVGRLGLSVDYEVDEADTRTHLYGIANLYYDFAGDMVTDLAGVDLVQGNDPLRGGIGVGGSYNWDNDKYSIFGEASVVTSLTNPASGHALNGNVGFRVRW